MKRIEALAHDCSVVVRSPSPQDIYTYSPGICALPDGRLIATMDMGGPGVPRLEGPKGTREGQPLQGRVYVSDDRGATWRLTAYFPYMHARPFWDDGRLYVIGQAGDIMIMCSTDRGEHFGEARRLTQGELWHQAPCNVWYEPGRVYLVMERTLQGEVKGWPVSVLEPVLMRGELGRDLTERAHWTFAQSAVFRDLVDLARTDYFGVPFYDVPRDRHLILCPGRDSGPMGWLETNVVRIFDPDHIWHDPSGRTFHLFMRAHTGRTNYACLAKVVEDENGRMTTMLERAPSGRALAYLPFPGGQMKFHMLYDAPSERYWLVSTQATDSMIRPERMPADRYGLPDNERRRLQLHFSKNCVDWCFAGLVDIGETEVASRHYASMCVADDDLMILSRSGDAQAKSPHNGNIITLHAVRDFRSLVY